MHKLYLAAFLALGAVPVEAQASEPAVPIEPSPDSAAERQALRTLTACLVKARPRWARRTLSLPYLSQAQAGAAAQALSGKDSCVPRTGAELRFRTSSMVGALADIYLRTDIQRVEMERLKSALARATPLNVSEDFALCVTARNPEAARDLVLSEPGSEAENKAVRKFASTIDPCTNAGEALTVDLQSLRSLVSTALYRGLTNGLAARN